ncbi:uncharacterized protein LOC119686052 [Teleopsis dalmanni]|uniref:uncharacterized protein LOC119678104 n=1 Tax=Teleopsis dalmanni TaxID=139649 RepID=UPI0018CF2127|nr:uncharacterized protein LOC119678104 [Teleopsis dalmanni]XP_037956440.1 uncharacterized protein LOC119686052 [Teleopsis dalmanni]
MLYIKLKLPWVFVIMLFFSHFIIGIWSTETAKRQRDDLLREGLEILTNLDEIKNTLPNLLQIAPRICPILQILISLFETILPILKNHYALIKPTCPVIKGLDVVSNGS